MAFLCVFALVLSCILCFHSLGNQYLVGCSVGSSCDEVLSSRWSFLFERIPVSGLAMLCYSVLNVCLLCRRRFDDEDQFAEWLDRGLLLMAGAILGAALWFVWLQMSMIRTFCPYCMTVHVCSIVLASILLLRIRVRGKGRVLGLFSGLVLAGALAFFQLFTTPRTAYDRGFIPEALPLPLPQEMPIVGDASRGKLITILFDYRCSHCQKIHSLLPQVVEQLGGQVAFVLAPVPLSKACNPYTSLAGEDRFLGSCELTKYALSLWRLDPAAFAVFDAWLFESVSPVGWRPREPEEAFAKACKLVGEERLHVALGDEWIAEYLSSVFELFGRTSSVDRSAVPRLICGEEWLVPDVDDAVGMSALIRATFLDR